MTKECEPMGVSEGEQDLPLNIKVASWTSQYEQGGRDVLAKAHSWKLYDQIRAMGLYPYFQPLDENQGPEALYQGKKVLMLGSNNYLGLTTHPKVREAAKQAIDRYGPSMTGSRFVNGTLTLHEELERELAEFLGKEAGLVFTTGYQANLGALTALINKTAVAVVDKLAHASVHDGCRLMEGENRRFQHNDLADCDRVMGEVSPEAGLMLVVDGVYSMEGDLAPLSEMIALCKKHRARFMVDDAHGLGVMGPGGRGSVHHFGVEKEVDLIVGTFSKSLASIGGYVVGDQKTIDFVKHFGRPMIFSASLPPPCIAAAAAALTILQQEPERVEQVRENARYMRDGLKSIGYNVGASETAVVPIVIGEDITTFCLWKDLLDNGVYTNPILYPAVARGKSMLRTSYLSTQTRDHLDRALDVFKKVGKNYDIGAAA